MRHSETITPIQKTAAWQRAEKLFIAACTQTVSQGSADERAIDAKTLRLKSLRLAKQECDR